MRLAATLTALCCGSLLAGSAAVAQNAPVPDFSGTWGRTTFDHEALPDRPSPVTNVIRLPSGTSDPARPAGDYLNPLLKPEAAEIVKKRAELAVSGKPFADPSSQCAPYPPPYIFAMELGLQMFQGKDEVTILYNQDSQVRHIRLNATHPEPVTPSWKGDSVGHYEGDTLVIDTIGLKTGPLGMVDRYGTPFSEALHLVERYRLIAGKDARQAVERHEKSAGSLGNGGGQADPVYDKGLQLMFSVEDSGVFAQPWSASITYQPVNRPWQELICAENTYEYYNDRNTPIPQAQVPDF
jgi:hypothetical protein